jgi:predicted nucleic acid-binding protein
MAGTPETIAVPSFIDWPVSGRTVRISATPRTSCAACGAQRGRVAGSEESVPKYLLDTDIIIEWLRRNERIVLWLEARDAGGDFLACTPVSVAEIYAGLRPREEFSVGELLQVLHCVEITERVGHKAGHYRYAFGPSHGVEIADALIAAAAHVYGLTLCSRNLRHYPMRDLKKLRL